MDFLVSQKDRNEASNDEEKRFLVNSIFTPTVLLQHRDAEMTDAAKKATEFTG